MRAHGACVCRARGVGQAWHACARWCEVARVEAARRRAVVRANSKCVRAAASFGARAYEGRRAAGRPVWSSKLQCIEPIRGRSPPQIAGRGSSMRGNAYIAPASLASICAFRACSRIRARAGLHICARARVCVREGCGRGAAGRRRRRAPSTALHEMPSMELSPAAIIFARVTSDLKVEVFSACQAVPARL